MIGTCGSSGDIAFHRFLQLSGNSADFSTEADKPHTPMPMNAKSFTILATIATSAAMLVFSGCSNSGTSTYKKSENAANSLLSAGDELVKTRSQIDTTLASLDSLVNQPATNLTAQYQNFVKQFGALEKQAAAVSEAAKTMRTKADTYLSTWGTQVAAIQNPDLRTAALDRRAEVAAQLQKLVADYASAANAYQPLQRSLKDIQQVLGADLTSAGLNTVKPYVSKAAADALPLKQSLDALTAQFKSLSTALKPTGPVATPTAAK